MQYQINCKLVQKIFHILLIYLLNFKTQPRLILEKLLQGRVDRLTKLKSGMENANNGIKDIVSVIGTGQEVKKM